MTYLSPVDMSMFVFKSKTNMTEDQRDYIQRFLPTVLPMINEQIRVLNTLIKSYNDALDQSQKIEALNNIKKYSKFIQDYHRGDVLNALPDFQNQIHIRLFKELQEHAGIISMPELSAPPLITPTISFDELLL